MAATMTDFYKRALDFVNQKPGYKASTIAPLLEVNPALVSASLWGSLRGKVRKAWEEGSYRWYPQQAPPPAVGMSRECREWCPQLQALSHSQVTVRKVLRYTDILPRTNRVVQLPSLASRSFVTE
jgi:hypothetical protein